MNQNIRMCALLAVLLWLPAVLCGCARRESAMLDEVLPAKEYETEAPGRRELSESDEAGEGDGAEETAAPDREYEADPGQADAAEQEAQVCYVHICGAVQEAGVYRMEAGDRIFAVVEQAGGFAPGACEDYVNLAKPVADGLRIWIPTQEEARKERNDNQRMSPVEDAGLEYPKESSAGGSPAQAGESGRLVNINTASLEQLMSLTGIGEAKARAIMEYRSGHGNFAEKEDIMKVAGIKQSGYDKIKDQITVKQE